jgi:hypothetical protein
MVYSFTFFRLWVMHLSFISKVHASILRSSIEVCTLSNIISGGEELTHALFCHFYLLQH